MLIRFLAIFLAFGGASALAGQQDACVKDDLGRAFCAPPGGSAVRAMRGVVCGVGKCVTDDLGRVVCSNTPSGGAIKDDLGRPLCVGKCVPAQQELCVGMSN